MVILILVCYIVVDKAYSIVSIEEKSENATEDLQPSQRKIIFTNSNVNKTDNPFDTESLSTHDRFVHRRAHLVESCRREGILGLEKYLVEQKSMPRPNILYLDEYQLIYCAIPKV